MKAETILQERRTLDDVLKSSVKAFENGCNFRLVKDDGIYFLEYGCYGVHKNLIQGDELLLLQWFETSSALEKLFDIINHVKKRKKKISGVVFPETILELLSRHPCEQCGGARFKQAPSR